MRIAFVLLCALPAAAAFSVQDLFGKPRTRARAKGYAVDAIRQKYTPPPTKGDQTPKKNPSPSRTSSPKMLVPPPMEAIDATSQLLCEVLDASGGRVAGEPPPNLSSSSVVIVIIPCQYAEPPSRDASVPLCSRAGAVDAPDWLLPACAAGCLTFPIVILYTLGDPGTDRYKREAAGGITLQERAFGDFKALLERRGVLKPSETPATGQAGIVMTAEDDDSIENQGSAPVETIVPRDGKRMDGTSGWREDMDRMRL